MTATESILTSQKRPPEKKGEQGKSAAAHTRGLTRRLPLPVVLYGILAVLILLPIGLVVLSSLTSTTPRPGNIGLDGLTFNNFIAVFGSAGARTAALNSLGVGLGSVVVALAIGGFLAFISARTNVYLRRFLYLVGLIPMFLPSYVGALAW